MNKSAKKLLVLIVVFFFIFIGFQPVFAKDTISPMKKSDTKELLEAILDIANNKEIQDIIKKSEINGSPIRFQQLLSRLQKEIIDAIEKNDTFNGRLKQISDLPCDCEKDNNITRWSFPVFCTLLIPLWIYGFYLDYKYGKEFLVSIISNIGLALNCYWRV